MKTISILVVVDVVGLLNTQSTEDKVFLIDSNNINGSLKEGTEALETKVEKGDVLMWNILPINPESYTGIADISIDSKYCKATKKTYEGTSINYWEGIVVKEPGKIEYSISLEVGHENQIFVAKQNPAIIGAS